MEDMTLGNLNDLDLKDDAGAAELPDEVPEQRGEFRPNPLPGFVVVQLPQDLSTLWDVMEANDPRAAKGSGKKVQRLRITFDENDSPLEIVTPVRGDENYPAGAGLGGKINNLERKRGKADDPDAPLVPDMYYVLEALGHDMEAFRAELKKNPKKANQVWGKALNQHAGELLKIKIAWTAQCRDDKTRYVPELNDDGSAYTGNFIEDPEGNQGCGKRVYMKDIPKDENGKYLERFTCPGCQEATLRAFAQFDQFRPVKPEERGQA